MNRTPPATKTREPGGRVALPVALVVAANLVVQLAWILAMPPFRAIDEFDHSFRAAAVAGGQWVAPSEPAKNGRGSYLRVPRELVLAAGPVCRAYDYTRRENCTPVKDVGDGRVTVASAASTYNPLFYWVVGTPSSLFDDFGFVYATRVVAAMLCSLLVGAAAWVLMSTYAGRWPLVALAAALSPCFVYSTTIGAPNGVEMCAGLTCLAAILGLRQRSQPGHEARVLLLLGVAAAVLVSVRLLGPVWLAMVVVLGVVVAGRRRSVEVVRSHPWTFAASASIAAAGAVWGLGWSLAHDTGPPVTDRFPDPLPDPVLSSVREIPVWILQSIAMGPTRGEPAPTIVYGLALALYASLLLFAARGLSRRDGLVLGAFVVVLVAVQVAIAAHAFEYYANVWQGRYALPVVVAVPLLLGTAARRSRRADLPLVAAAVMVAVSVVLQGVEVVRIAHHEEGRPMYAGSSWAPHQAPLLVGLVVVGLVLWVAAVRRTPERPVADR